MIQVPSLSMVLEMTRAPTSQLAVLLMTIFWQDFPPWTFTVSCEQASVPPLQVWRHCSQQGGVAGVESSQGPERLTR